MTVVLSAVLALAAVLLLRPPGGATGRFLRAVGRQPVGRQTFGRGAGGSRTGLSLAVGRGGEGRFPQRVVWLGSGHGTPGLGAGVPVRTSEGAAGHLPASGILSRFRHQRDCLSLTLVVQQLAALLKGGRTPARLWDELWLVHAGRPETAPGGVEPAGRRTEGARWSATQFAPAASGRPGPSLSAGSLVMLGAIRAAAYRGAPVSEAIRTTVQAVFPRNGKRESRIWCELAACFDIAEASGCPLADVLARFAAQLEVEDDAEAARQTALAGPKATVSLLTWLPAMGLGLGMALGVDPLAILIGTPLGIAALAAGVVLTIAGRIWSARLVQAAAGAGMA